MFLSGFVSGLIAQCEMSQLLDELFGSLDDPASLDESGEEIRERSLALAS
jgi:hypothetical protein